MRRLLLAGTSDILTPEAVNAREMASSCSSESTENPRMCPEIVPSSYGRPIRARKERFGSLKLAVDLLLQRVNKSFEHQNAIEKEWGRIEEPLLLL